MKTDRSCGFVNVILGRSERRERGKKEERLDFIPCRTQEYQGLFALPVDLHKPSGVEGNQHESHPNDAAYDGDQTSSPVSENAPPPYCCETAAAHLGIMLAIRTSSVSTSSMTLG